MKKITHLLLLSLFTLSSALCRAEGEPSITHNINDMLLTPARLSFSAGNKIGTTTDGLIYTCTGSAATFGLDCSYSTYITLNMGKADDIITVTPAIEELTKLELYFYPQNTQRTAIEVYVSTDGVNWGEAVSGENRDDGNGLIRIKNLPRNNYYIQLRNKTNTAVSIFELRYYQTSCRCLRIVSL